MIVAFIPFITMCMGPNGPMTRRWDDTGPYGCGFGWGYGYGGMFMGIIILIALIAAAVFLFQYLKSKNAGGRIQETPLDILKKRYARGELTKEDFDRIRRDLQ